jgi:hypothetical protein
LAGPNCADKLYVVGWGPCAIDLSDEHIEEAARRPIVLHVSNDFERKGVTGAEGRAVRLRRGRGPGREAAG